MPKRKIGISKNNKHVCPTCKKPTAEGGHLCVPISKRDKKCDWCGALIAQGRHLCNEKIKAVSYICNTCGRTAVSEEYLCKPKKIK